MCSWWLMHCTAPKQNISIITGSSTGQGCCLKSIKNSLSFQSLCYAGSKFFSSIQNPGIFGSNLVLPYTTPINNPYSRTLWRFHSPLPRRPSLTPLFLILPSRFSLLPLLTIFQWRKKNMDFGVRVKWTKFHLY